MIWQSTVLMTLIDLVIVVVTTASLVVLYMHRRRLVGAGVVWGAVAMVGGIYPRDGRGRCGRWKC